MGKIWQFLSRDYLTKESVGFRLVVVAVKEKATYNNQPNNQPIALFMPEHLTSHHHHYYIGC